MNLDFIVIGLGNPGNRYAMTRHNIGFIALDLLAQEHRTKVTSSGLGNKIEAAVAEITISDKKILLIKPQTFMNLSGQSLQKLYQIHSHLREVPLVCIHDEVDLQLPKVRIKFGGSDAGHNGLKSIRATLGHGDYYRIRLGVGRPDANSSLEVADHVLQNFSTAEEPFLIESLSKSLEVLNTLISQGLEKAIVAASLEKKK